MNKRIRNIITNGLFLLPALFFFTISVYYPLVYSIMLSFTNWDGFDPQLKFVGLYNYKMLIEFPDLLQAFANTIKFAVFTTILQNILQLLLALILDMNMKSRSFIRASFYVPCLLSTVVISAIFSYILQYHGVLNNLFGTIGLGILENDWFGNTKTALGLIMALNIWQWTGFGAIIYLAGLQSIPVEYYEAASIDGARSWGKFRNITFPLLMPSVTIMTFLALAGGMKLFELPFIITNGGPAGATETVGTFLIKENAKGKVALACAVAVILMLMVAILAIIQINITRKREVEA